MERTIDIYKSGTDIHKGNDARQIFAEGNTFSMDDIETNLNNNVMLIGSPGSGKTTLLKANLLEATGSYVVSDPKSQLYREFKGYLGDRGYRVLCLDFKNLMNGESAHFNPFHYIRNEDDILKVSALLSGDCINKNDPFWDQASSLLYSAIISYLVFECNLPTRNLKNMISLLNLASSTRDADIKSDLDLIFEHLEKKKPDSYAVRQYQRYRAMATKTLLSVLITAQAKLAFFDTPTINELTNYDDIDIPSIGDRPTALFVSVSDTDRSMDSLASLFFTTLIQQLVRHADECKEGRLPVKTRIFLDDFGTNLKIEEYPRIISSIRSRNISTWTIVQSKGQLEKIYGDDANTILGSCDHVIYQGGNDLASAKYIAERCNIQLSSVLGMKLGQSIIISRGNQMPVFAKNYDLSLHGKELKKYRQSRLDNIRKNEKVGRKIGLKYNSKSI